MTGPAEFNAALARDNPEELLHLAISLSMDPPEDEHPGEAERICRSLARHAHPNVRGNAVLGFGHLARTAGIIWKPVEVRALVEAGLADANPYVRGQAEAAASDLRRFLKWKLKSPKGLSVPTCWPQAAGRSAPLDRIFSRL